MAIIENRTTEEGDVLIIRPEVPVVGLISLYNFVDTTVGESETDYYLKEFRYSINGGLTFSQWVELNITNISNVDISKENQFVIEYRYTRVGTSPAVDLEFEDILVSGETEELPYPIYNTIYFKDLFEVNNINVYGWALNVLEKLYLKGHLPEYLERGQGHDVLSDQDFLSFWNAITHYFAILVYYARQFRDITGNLNLLEAFLISRGVEVGNAPLEDLITVFNNYLSQFENRGTASITDKKVDGSLIDGELIRLIGYEYPEEFIFALLRNHEMGWCIGKSSPVWNGTEKITNLIKAYEYTEEVVDLNKYPLLNPSFISIVGGKMVISNVGGSTKSGIYQTADETKFIEVNQNLDYEISFFVETTNINTTMTFGVKCYDVDKNSVNLIDMTSGLVKNEFFIKQKLLVANNVYFIRGVIFNQNKNVVNGVFSPDITKKMFRNGTYLKFDPNYAVKFIVPNILLDNALVSGNNLSISNIKIRPLKTPMTRGQLGMKNIILAYIANKNKSHSSNKIENIIRSGLISANSFLKIKYL